jgi:hypothetical protein
VRKLLQKNQNLTYKIDKEIERLKPATRAIILPRYQETCITNQEFGQKNPVQLTHENDIYVRD